MTDPIYLKKIVSRARGEATDQESVDDKSNSSTAMKDKAYEVASKNKQIEPVGKLVQEEDISKAFMKLKASSDRIDKDIEIEQKHQISSNKIHLTKLISLIKDKNIEGDKKRLIRFEEKNENILKLLQIFYSIDVTVLVNHIIDEYFTHNPELIAEIKQSLTNIDL